LICDKAGETVDLNKANVEKRCIIDGADECIIETQLTEHNKQRLDHEGGTVLEADKKMSAAMQALLDAKSTDDMALVPFKLVDSSKRGSKWTSCAENIYVIADGEEVNVASSKWAAGREHYDPETGAGKTDLDDAKKKNLN
jgi:hypothetical protein